MMKKMSYVNDEAMEKTQCEKEEEMETRERIGRINLMRN